MGEVAREDLAAQDQREGKGKVIRKDTGEVDRDRHGMGVRN
jgi:hypothetical protein